MQNGSVQMRLNAPFVDLNHRPQYTRRPAPRSNSRFLGWFHRPRPGGLAPPVCTNLPSLQAEPIVRKKSYVIGSHPVPASGPATMPAKQLGQVFAIPRHLSKGEKLNTVEAAHFQRAQEMHPVNLLAYPRAASPSKCVSISSSVFPFVSGKNTRAIR